MTPEQWIIYGNTGTSSRTIWAVMMGVVNKDLQDKSWNPRYFSVPFDSADFGRCYDLLVFVPQWRKRLPEVAAAFPDWGPLVEKWAELEKLFCAERETGEYPKTYALIRRLRDEGMRRDGWLEGPLGCWNKYHQAEATP